METLWNRETRTGRPVGGAGSGAKKFNTTFPFLSNQIQKCLPFTGRGVEGGSAKFKRTLTPPPPRFQCRIFNLSHIFDLLESDLGGIRCVSVRGKLYPLFKT